MRRDLPSGTVTFVFTDVEGSTKLLHELGAERYAEALAEHRRLVREACAAEGGVEVDTQGDAFFFAFRSPRDAVQAAAAFTDALERGQIRVRVGVHTGRPLVTAEGYIGDDVHLAARIGAASHGGQVVLSRSTAELVDADLRELGEHRLKDVDAPVSIYQLGNGAFPPLKTVSNTNLPRPASSFVGRERELDELLARIRQGARLLTLTGPGGSGKSRLAIEAAATLVPAYKAGVFWVGLASLRDPARVTEQIAQTLGAKAELADHIGERELLLVLDNFEQVVAAAREIAALLERCANLTVLVTSRELLRVRGEVQYAVPPLAEPDAVQLFCERSGLEPSDEIGQLCARLDALPLAVELAAARTTAVTPGQILERLSQRLDLLRGGRDADPRQQTLRATIEWSHGLLEAEEQALFRRLAVFAGGCTGEAAEAVSDADLDILQSLVEKSLLRFSDGRFWMLETIREYALERLDAAGESGDVHLRHVEHFASVAEAAKLTAEAESGRRHDEVIREQENLRAAIDWCVSEGDARRALEIAVALENFWVTTNPFEGMRRFEALEQSAVDVPARLRARALRAYGGSCSLAGRRDLARSAWEQSLALFEAEGSDRDVAVLLHRLADGDLQQGRVEDARPLLEKSLRLFRAVGSQRGEGQVLGSLGRVAQAEGDLEGAMELFGRSADMVGELGIAWWQTRMLAAKTECALGLGRLDDAEQSGLDHVSVAAAISDRQGIVYALANLARVAARRSDLRRAGALWGTIEAEEARGPLGAWADERDGLASEIVSDAPTFEAGRAFGLALPLEEAVEYARGSS